MCIMVMLGTEEDPQKFKDRLGRYPMSLVLIIFPCIEGLFFAGVMLGFHTYLLFVDLTTKEYLDEKWAPLVGSPEKKNSCFKNLIKVFVQSRQLQPKYKHSAFPYYNNEPDSSSNTGNRNSKGSDPEGKKKEPGSSFSE